jgi:DNA-binding CsgD family transcriptional regulator
MRPRARHAGECRGEPLAPAGSARGGVAIGLREIVGPILSRRSRRAQPQRHVYRRIAEGLGPLLCEAGFVDRDPILNALQVRRGAFSFNDIHRDPRFSRVDRDMLRAAAENGWARGLAVPIARGGTRFGLVTLIGRGQKEFEQSQRTFLCLISECPLIRIRSLGAEVDYVAPAGMSRREIEAARSVALGFSDEEIGAKLGISASTAHHHVESARSHLKARTRAHLTALCVSLGIAAAT